VTAGGRAVLLELQQAHAFDPVPLRAGLAGNHVPFDTLTGTTDTEAQLSRCLLGAERVAVAGRSGVGKTSLVQYVCGELSNEIAPIRVPVAAEDDATIGDPAAFCQHLIRTVTLHLSDAKSIDDATRTELLAGTAAAVDLNKRTSRRSSFGLARWMLQADIARDVETAATATWYRSGAEHIAQARDVVAAVAARGLVLTIVIDDSDAWLATAVGDRSALIEPFFGRVLRVLAEELNAAIVVAVHDRYFDLPSFPRGRGFLEQTIHVPPLPHRRALEAILTARVGQQSTLTARDVITDDGLDALHAGYQVVDGNIRTTLLLAHTALQAACEDDAVAITGRHIEIAVSRYRDVPG